MIVRCRYWNSVVCVTFGLLFCAFVLDMTSLLIKEYLIVREEDLREAILQKEREERECKPLRFSKNLTLTALFSYPGSGSAWLRHLLQQATGIYTGSIYNDKKLKKLGFLGEHVKDDTVLVVKMHLPYDPIKMSRYERAIILLRHPLDTVLAQFNNINSHERNRTGHANPLLFKTQMWLRFVEDRSDQWVMLHLGWTEFPRPMLLVHYEDLKENLESELTRILEFLNQNVTEEEMKCVLENAQGMFRRPSRQLDFEIYTKEMKQNLENKAQEVYEEFETVQRKREL